MNKLATAAPLIAGTLIFFIGVTIPVVTSLTLEVWLSSPEKSLTLIARNPGAYRATNALLIVAAVVTLLGIAQLVDLLPDNGWGKAGMTLFFLGAVFWIIELSLRLSVMV